VELPEGKKHAAFMAHDWDNNGELEEFGRN